jgi:hypothetical protein
MIFLHLADTGEKNGSTMRMLFTELKKIDHSVSNSIVQYSHRAWVTHKTSQADMFK